MILMKFRIYRASDDSGRTCPVDGAIQNGTYIDSFWEIEKPRWEVEINTAQDILNLYDVCQKMVDEENTAKRNSYGISMGYQHPSSFDGLIFTKDEIEIYDGYIE